MELGFRRLYSGCGRCALRPASLFSNCVDTMAKSKVRRDDLTASDTPNHSADTRACPCHCRTTPTTTRWAFATHDGGMAMLVSHKLHARYLVSQNKKAHRNGIKKPAANKYTKTKGVGQGEEASYDTDHD